MTLAVDDAKVALYLTNEANEALRASLRNLAKILEAYWRFEGWNCEENSAQVPLDELEARNEARRLLGEPYSEDPR